MATGESRKSPSRLILFPLLVLLVGIPVSFALYVMVQNSVAKVAQLQFEREAEAANNVLDNRLHSYSHVLYAMRALFDSEEPVRRDRFHRFVNSLDVQNRYPGFMSLNFAAYVPAAKKGDFEASVRGDTSIEPRGYPKFSIKPPGDRPEYFVITYLEPMAGYEFAFGLDLTANPMASDREKVADAARRGRDTGRLFASAQPLRVKKDKEVIYLAMRLAIYKPGKPVDTVARRRDAYIGSVGAAFDVESVIRAALSLDVLRRIRCKLYDAGLASDHERADLRRERRLLFDSRSILELAATPISDDGDRAMLVHSDRIIMADRVWELEYSASRDTIISEVDKRLPLLALIGGLLTTFLLFGIVYSLANSRRRAEAMAADITRDLRDSERGLAEAQRMARLGNWALDPANWTMHWSEETYRLFGLRAFSSPQTYALFLQRVHPEDREVVDQALRRALANKEDASFEHRIVLPHGRVRWVHTLAKPSTPNRQGRIPGIVMDITERKHAEMDLKHSHEQLQGLSRQLVDAQESERRRISAELHDVVGQNLTALSINLDIVKEQVAGDNSAAIGERLADSARLLQSTSEAIENVMAALRPPMLDDYGLLPALEWYAEQFAARTGIQVKVSGDDGPRVPPAAEIALFRVVQEALNNVAKHAHAKNVQVCIERDGATCVVSVTDDGAGIEATRSAVPRRRPGLGMITMRERMQAIGGSVSVRGAAGHGTRVEMRVPC